MASTQRIEFDELNDPKNAVLKTDGVAGLDADRNVDVPPAGGKQQDKPETLKTFTIEVDDAWMLP